MHSKTNLSSGLSRSPDDGRTGAKLYLEDGLALFRTRAFELSVLAWSLPFGVAILTYLKYWGRPRQIRMLLRLWSSGFIHCARVIAGVDWRIVGAENVPNEPVIYVANHQSYWESIAFTAFVPDLNVISKREATRIPVFGFGIERAPMTLVDRKAKGQNIRKMVADVRRTLDEGRSVLIYPEGTRIDPGQRGRFNRGVELLCRSCDARVIPVVHNAGLFWPSGFGSKRPGAITVKFLPPLDHRSGDGSTLAVLEELLNREKDLLLPAAD